MLFCACTTAFQQAQPAQALALAVHTPVCTRLCCDGASALITFVCTSSDACNGPRNVHSPTLASEGRCVTDPGHPRLVHTADAPLSPQKPMFSCAVRADQRCRKNQCIRALFVRCLRRCTAGRFVQAWSGLYVNDPPPQSLPTQAPVPSYEGHSQCQPARLTHCAQVQLPASWWAL